MKNFTELTPIRTFLQKDENGREINFYKLNNAIPLNFSYPNVYFESDEGEIFTIKEKVMSLEKLNAFDLASSLLYNELGVTKLIETPVFHFIYNTDNYYHFVYDTLPYLISYFELKKEIPELKLLMNYPNKDKKEFYRFVTEFLDLLEISKEDILIVNSDFKYKEIYISNSYTHDFNSNVAPREEIYDLYKKLVKRAKKLYKGKVSDLPKYIYISRRTWISKDTSNIGTNYTTRRKLIIEDELVEFLTKECGYTEVFTENLTTIEKIMMFHYAKYVIGAIGGGLCNVLFSKQECNLLALISPTFLDVNSRFLFSFDKVNLHMYHGKHAEEGKWKKWMRVKTKNGKIVGEVNKIKEDTLEILYTEEAVAGWNNDMKLSKVEIYKEECIPLDKGLNSAWSFDLNEFIFEIKNIELND